MDDYTIEHQRAKHVGMIPARFVMRDGKQYHLVTGLPVRTISGDDDDGDPCDHGRTREQYCFGCDYGS